MTSEDDVFEAVGVLGDPVRRRLYQQVASAPGPVGREAAAAAAGVSRSLAAFHLDKLVEAGLLAVEYRRLSGRSGPGAGRPAKLYLRPPGERVVSLPPRAYATAARLLADVVERAGLDRELQAAARAAAAVEGEALGADVGPVEALRSRGYEPYWDRAATEGEATDGEAADGEAADGEAAEGEAPDGRGVLRLHNCPFHALADRFPALVCGMNLALIEGLLPGCAGGVDWTAVMDPSAEGCCVALKSKNNIS